MDPSRAHLRGLQESPIGSPPLRDATDLGPIPRAAGEGQFRSRIRISWPHFGGRGRIGLILLGLVVVPWLPICGPPGDPTPARIRGTGQAPVLALAFAGEGATIATLHGGGRVTLRDASGGVPGTSLLDHRGPARSMAVAPDGRSLIVGDTGADLRLYDIGAGGAGRALGIPIRWARGLGFSPDGRTLAASK